MHRWSTRLGAACLNRYTATALTASLLGLLAALPAPAASAQGGAPASSGGLIGPQTALPSYELSKLLSPEQLEQLLSTLPVGELGSGAITPEALAEALAKLPALQSLEITGLKEALQTALEGLGGGTSLKEALEDPTKLVPTTTTTLEGLLGPLNLSLLEGLLGESLSSALEGALSTVKATEVVSSLLGSATSPSETLGQLLSLLPAPALEEELGGVGSGAPVSEETTEKLAESLGMTTGELAGSLHTPVEDLAPAGAALLAPLTNGETLTMTTSTVGSLLAGTLKSVTPEGGEGSGSGSGEGSGSGSGSSTGGTGSSTGKSASGGAGGGSTATSSGTTVIVNEPKATSSKKHNATTGSIKILSDRVEGHVVRLLLAIPGPGRIVVHHTGLKTVRRHVGKARRLSVLVPLSRTGLASVKRHMRGHKGPLKMRLTVRFIPRHGKGSHASVTLRLR